MARRDDELAVLLKRLAHRQRVYVRSGLLPATGGGVSGVLAAVAAEVHTLLRQLSRRDWQDSAGPASVQEVEAALEPVGSKHAAELMGRLASECLVWSGSFFMAPAEADAFAGQVVELLGTEARWWTNRDGNSWTGVSGCTFDSLVAGTDGRRFAVLIQVGED